MCKCKSYNRPEVGTEPDVLLNPNDFFDWDSPAKIVAIDACIAEEVRTLWKNGVWTGGSCCGHNGMFDRSIIIEDIPNHLLVEDIKNLIKPETKLQMWQLTDL